MWPKEQPFPSVAVLSPRSSLRMPTLSPKCNSTTSLRLWISGVDKRAFYSTALDQERPGVMQLEENAIQSGLSESEAT
jgi:hypothetical protein